MGEDINTARELASDGYYERSFELYLEIFDNDPGAVGLYESELRTVLARLSESLASSSRAEAIFINFGRALAYYSNSPRMLNEIAKYLFKFGFYKEAWIHFQKALKCDNSFVDPEKNLNSVKNVLVERWHFRMLNDKVRNEAYRKALRATVTRKDSVLDIGTGSGLLTLYAQENKPLTVLGCDGSEQMVNIADAVVEENGRCIIIVKGMSRDLDYKDVGGKRSVLVTELFDAGLFGEHILQTVAHAKANLMQSTVKVVPNRAELFVVGAKSDCINLKYQLGRNAKEFLNIQKYVHVLTGDETYDCEDVHLYKDVEYMTEFRSLIKVDFNDTNDILEKLDMCEPIPIELKGIKNGEMNVLIGWFNLYLTDSVTITTDPQSKERANAWQQAIFFDNAPVNVEENQTINLEFILQDSKVSLLPNHSAPVMRVSAETLRFLNDSVFTKEITRFIGVITVYLGQLADMTDTSIVDLCPFPVFGLLMLKRGARALTCYAKTKDDRDFFETVMMANNIDLGKLTILTGEHWSTEAFGNEKYHAIFCNILELCGDICPRMKGIADCLKHHHLIEGGLYMPARIKMYAQLVSSRWLDINNKVFDENVSNYKIAKHINKFQVSQNFNMDLSLLEYDAVSEPAVLATYNRRITSDVIDIPIKKDGVVNAALCWYGIELIADLGEIPTNAANSFVDSMVFLTNPEIPMVKGDTGNIILCIDPDKSFKLLIDVEDHPDEDV